MKKLIALFPVLLCVIAFSNSARAETAQKENNEEQFYVLDHFELNNFEPSRKNSYLTTLEKLLRLNKELPLETLADLKKKSQSDYDWTIFEEKVQRLCTENPTLKKSCEQIAKLRIDTINMNSAGKPEQKTKSDKK